MASGKTHDFVNIALLPATLVVLRPEGLFSYIFGYLVATIWLSPDLDLKQSRPFQRWGYLSKIWIPYTKVFRHRSFFTHFPIIGISIRLIYLAALVFFIYYFILALFAIIDRVAETNLFFLFQNLIKEYVLTETSYLSIKDFLLGLFVADTIHFILDYSTTYINKFRKLFFKKFAKIFSFKKG